MRQVAEQQARVAAEAEQHAVHSEALAALRTSLAQCTAERDAAGRRAASAEEKAAGAERRAASAEGKATVAEEKAASAEGRVAGAEGKAASAEGKAAGAERRAASAEGTAADAERARSEAVQRADRLAAEVLDAQVGRS